MITRFSLALLLLFTLTAICVAKDPISDDVISDQVRLKLADDQIVKGGALNVEVKGGVVTLAGQVELPKQKERATKVAKKVKGVKQVVNNITLRDKNAYK